MASLKAAFKRHRAIAYVAAGTTITAGVAYSYLSPRHAAFPPPPPGGRPPPPWSPPTRAEMLSSLKASVPLTVIKNQTDLKGDEEFDLLVVGGGATGAGVAVDAATRGLKVALVERDDFSSGTSSKSTKLVHGGVRYLQKAVLELDYEQYKLVREALHERRIFLQTAPYLSHMLPIMLPLYKYWQLPYYWAGCKAYDLLAGSENMESSYIMTKGKALEAFPMLKADGLVGALVYYDGQHNDARMNVSLIMTAVQHGATVANHTEVVDLHKNDAGQLKGARVRDNLTGNEFNIRAKGVINATGPFSDALLAMDAPPGSAAPAKPIVAPSSGVHITLPNYYSPRTMGLLDPATSDGRVIFFLPWQGNTIAGTTDTPTDVERNPLPKEEEIQWILDEVKRYLSPDIKVRRGDVLAAWSGLRPLIRDPASPNSKDLVRNHLIYTSPSGMITIAGGKWTTYRAMAAETVDEAVKHFGLLRPGVEAECITEKVRLLGSDGWSRNMFIGLIQRFGLETEVAKHLSDTYGDRAWAVCSMAEGTGQRWPLHGVRLNDSYPYIEAEVRYAARNEYAQTAVDFIARRSRISFLNAQAALDMLPRVIDIMGGELGWDAGRKDAEWLNARKFLQSMGLPAYGELPIDKVAAQSQQGAWSKVKNTLKSAVNPVIKAATTSGAGVHSRAHFSLDELDTLKKAFTTKTGGALEASNTASKEQLLEVVRDLGYSNTATLSSVDEALESVGVTASRGITFDDFVDAAGHLKEKSLRVPSTAGSTTTSERRKIPVEKSGGGV